MTISLEDFKELTSGEQISLLEDVLYNTIVDGENASRLWQEAAGTVTLRNGDVVENLRKRLEDVGYSAPVPYDANIEVTSSTFTVSEDGIVYAPEPSEVPFTTGLTFDPTKWKMVSFPRIFASTDDFFTWAAASTGVVGSIVHVLSPSAKVLTYTFDGVSTAFVDESTDGWAPVPPYYLEHWGVETSVNKDAPTVDYTTQINKAVQSVTGEIIMTGWVKVTDQIAQENGSRLTCPMGAQHGGFSIFTDFNAAAGSVLRPGTAEPACANGNIGFRFEQPTSPANRAALNSYPAAIDIGGLARVSFEHIRIEGAEVGVLGATNCGGHYIERLEGSAYDALYRVNEAMDAVKVGALHYWRFGLTTDQAALFEDGASYAMDLERVDAFQCGLMTTFNAQARFNDDAGVVEHPYQISVANLDGSNSGVSILDGSVSFGSIAFAQSELSDATDRSITAAGDSRVYIGHLSGRLDGSAAILSVGDSLVVIDQTDVRDVDPNRTVFQANDNSHMVLRSNVWSWDGSVARTQPIARQNVATASMEIGPVTVDGVTGAGQEIIRYQGDNPRNYLNCGNINPHTAFFSLQSSEGFYCANGIRVRNSQDGYTAIDRNTKYSDTDEGYQLDFRRARGDADTPTALLDNDNIGDIVFGAYDGDSFNYGAYLRAFMDADATDGVTPMRVSFLMQDTAGVTQTPLDIRSNRVYINTDITHNSDAVDVNYNGQWFLRHRMDDQDLFIGATNSTDGLFYPLAIDASTKDLTLGRGSGQDVFVTDGSKLGVGDFFDLSHEFTVSATDNPHIQFVDIGNYTWQMGIVGNNDFEITRSGSETQTVLIDQDGNTTLSGGLTVEPNTAATDDIQFKFSSFKPHLVLEDQSTDANDWQIFSDTGGLTFLYGDAGTGTKLANEVLRINSLVDDIPWFLHSDDFRFYRPNGTSELLFRIQETQATLNVPLTLGGDGTEGGEVRFKDAGGSDDFFIDVDSSNNLRIRRSNGAGIVLTETGNIILNSIPTYADDAAAGTGGLTEGMVYKTSTGEMRIKT